MKSTVFIRTYNEEKYIALCLEKVLSQKGVEQPEIIILDSCSSDKTVEIASRFPVVIYKIPVRLFHYSSTLNFGVSKTETELFASLSAHAIPYDENWLEGLIEPLRRDPEILCSFSRQLPWPECSEQEKTAIYANFPDNDRIVDSSILENRDCNQLYRAVAFSNVSSCFRTSWLTAHPFRLVPFSEDRLSALEVLKGNGKFAYASRSCVYHAHFPTFYEFRNVARKATVARRYIEHAADCETSSRAPSAIFGAFKAAIYAVSLLLLIPWRLIRSSSGSKLRSCMYAFAELGISLGKMEGARIVSQKEDWQLQPADPTEIMASAELVSN